MGQDRVRLRASVAVAAPAFRPFAEDRAVLVRPFRAFQNAQIDNQPDKAHDRDEEKQAPPAGFVPIMAALHVDG